MRRAFFLHRLDEQEFDDLVLGEGGERAHPDQDHRLAKGADYVIGSAAIELKTINEERLLKPEAQFKLAALFNEEQTAPPVKVIDRNILTEQAQRTYDQILQGPLKSDIKKAKKQLDQTRKERAELTLSVLWLHNNGYDTLSHEELIAIALKRVRNDTSKIDGIIVSSVHYSSDGFDTEVMWPIDFCPILVKDFPEFEMIRDGWNKLANKTMTAMVQGGFNQERSEKPPIDDIVFEVGGTTFVKPSPVLSSKSEFFARGRPRINSSGIEVCPAVATTFPKLNFSEWRRIKEAIKYEDSMFVEFNDLDKQLALAIAQASLLQPVVPIKVKYDAWIEWCESRDEELTGHSVRSFANFLFETKCRKILDSAREVNDQIFKSSYIGVTTTEVGRDKANDLSSIALIVEGVGGSSVIELVNDVRIFHEHAIVLASAYAVCKQVSQVCWYRDRRYCWH